MHKLIYILLFFTLFQNSKGLCSDNRLTSESPKDSTSNTEESIKVTHGDKGVEFATSDGNFKLQIQSRFQFRYSYPFDSDPVTYSDYQKDKTQTFNINRARIKVGGNVFNPWLNFYWEYDITSSNLLDFRFMIEKFSF